MVAITYQRQSHHFKSYHQNLYIISVEDAPQPKFLLLFFIFRQNTVESICQPSFFSRPK